MKSIERITIMTLAGVYTGYLIQQAVRARAERLFRLAAGESDYERVHLAQHCASLRRLRVSSRTRSSCGLSPVGRGGLAAP